MKVLAGAVVWERLRMKSISKENAQQVSLCMKIVNLLCYSWLLFIISIPIPISISRYTHCIHISDNGLISRIYIELNNKKKTN